MAATNKTERISAAEFVASKGRKSAAKKLNLGFDFTEQDVLRNMMEDRENAANYQPAPNNNFHLCGQQIIIEHEPMGAPRMVQSDKWKKREVVLRYFALKDAVRKACEAVGYKMGGTLTVDFELSMPKSWPQKKRDFLRGKPHQQKPDIDNMGKAVADSFNEDDSHVHTMRLSKTWADVGRIIITP